MPLCSRDLLRIHLLRKVLVDLEVEDSAALPTFCNAKVSGTSDAVQIPKAAPFHWLEFSAIVAYCRGFGPHCPHYKVVDKGAVSL